jgi:hypothetical protein
MKPQYPNHHCARTPAAYRLIRCLDGLDVYLPLTRHSSAAFLVCVYGSSLTNYHVLHRQGGEYWIDDVTKLRAQYPQHMDVLCAMAEMVA